MMSKCAVRTAVLSAAALCVLVLLPQTGYAGQGPVLYGCTNGTGDSGFWTGGDIFTVNTSTGAAVVLKSYTQAGDGIYAFGDIAFTTHHLYATVWNTTSYDFTTLVKMDFLGNIVNSWNIGAYGTDGSGAQRQVNSLHGANDNTLYGIEGGGVSNADLVRFDLDPNGDLIIRTDLGVVGNAADGDLANNPETDVWYGTFWSATGSTLDTITLSPVGKTVGPNTGMDAGGGACAGLEFTTVGYDYTDGLTGTLWAGTYNDQKLYSIDSLTTGGHTMRYDLSPVLGGTITGLTIPEPATMSLLVLGGLALRRRRR